MCCPAGVPLRTAVGLAECVLSGVSVCCCLRVCSHLHEHLCRRYGHADHCCICMAAYVNKHCPDTFFGVILILLASTAQWQF
jgi:hypothetical protein